MTPGDDAFQWAVYEIWKMRNRSLFCHASKISKMSFCNLNGGQRGGTAVPAQPTALEEKFPHNKNLTFCTFYFLPLYVFIFNLKTFTQLNCVLTLNQFLNLVLLYPELYRIT